MGKIYKDKKSKGCALCKPHKHGWAPKKKVKILAFERETDKEIFIFMAITGYVILSREKALYLKDRENQARVLVEAAADYRVLLPQYADRNIITSMKF